MATLKHIQLLPTDIPKYYNASIFSYLLNLSNPTHQGTREMCLIVQDVGILRFYFS